MSNVELSADLIKSMGYTDEDCLHCGGMECIINPDYTEWADNVGDQLPEGIANDSRRFSENPAAQREWDAENNAPPRYLPCPECATLTPAPITMAVVKAWHDGFAPLVGASALQALRGALIADDPRLLQGATTEPPPLQPFLDQKPTACCALCWLGWHSNRTIGDVEDFFSWICEKACVATGDPETARYFLNWVDETPREQMRGCLLALVEYTLAERRPKK